MTLLSFDILGRVTGHKQTTDGQQYTTGYSYNLAGALVEETYPSGRVVKNVLDNSGDLLIVESRKNASSGYWHYADAFTYNAAGAVTSMQLGNGRWESTTFNSRLQPTQIALGTTPGTTDKLKLEFAYGTTANNGNVLSQTISVPTVGTNTGFTAVQTYSYDSLNRLKDATENLTPNGGSQTQSWKQTFTFDRYGNRRFDFTSGNTTVPVSSCTEAICNPTISTSNNRLTSTGWLYDNAGNTTRDGNYQTFTYDAENKQVEVKNSSSVTLGQYWYDGDGKRVKKVVPATGETTIFVYDATGNSIAEYSTIVASVEDAKVAYLTNDHLGSPRINTDAAGIVTARHDYHPYGEEIITTQRTSHAEYTPDSVRKQFTGYERDGETMLDFAKARTYASSLARFTTADPLLSSGKSPMPQTWNRYAYTTNNPASNFDPLGLYVCRSKDKNFCGKFDAALDKARGNLAKIEEKYGKDSKQYEKASRALGVYGEKGVNNGVFVVGKDGVGAGRTDVQGVRVAKTATNPNGQKIMIGFDIAAGDHSNFSNLIGHEGSHAADGSDWVSSGFKDSHNPTEYETELKGYTVQGLLAEAQGSTLSVVQTNVDFSKMKGLDRFAAWPYEAVIWNSSWAAADVDTLRKSAIDHHLQYDKDYKLTPTNLAGKAQAFVKGHLASL